ncbi:hypothetical protein [Pleomorphomonas carboxyditropha]|uniref:Uncharacterized protein n=1 Tax=Pleomorphomonas carboxyditropha TaxID=2023338 RepID=A0A2G9WPM1_9HYPH|nr:hypothetical protein [Pleomorphomonas carboxyditropha]PIO96623.1 hypothetical protein CJ014_24560 [Pleomorphomonas carboxyditropha]
MDLLVESILSPIYWLAAKALFFLSRSFLIPIFGVPFISAAAVLHFAKPEFKLGRAGYFFAISLFFLLALVSLKLIFVSLLFLPKSNFFPLWVLATYGCLVAMGILLGLASAARAMDAYGHRTYWFLGFIPIANLALLIKRPQEPKGLDFQRLAGNTLLIIIGILLIGTVKLQMEFLQRGVVVIVGNG